MLPGAKPGTFLAVSDKAKAREFFEQKLGLKFVTDDGFALVFDLGGLGLRISAVAKFTPQTFTVLGWVVKDIRAERAALVAKGVAFEHYPFVKDEEGIWSAPDGTKVAWFKDPDGNVLSLTEHVDK